MIFVKHEVVTKDFEGALPAVGVKLAVDRPDGVLYERFYFREHRLGKVDLDVDRLKVLLELWVGDLCAVREKSLTLLPFSYLP